MNYRTYSEGTVFNHHDFEHHDFDYNDNDDDNSTHNHDYNFYNFDNLYNFYNPTRRQFLETTGEFDRVSVRGILPEQAQRFTISPSGRLIAIFPDRAVNGLIIYAFDGTTGSSDPSDPGQTDLRSAGDNGVPVAATNVQLTCAIDANGFLSCSRAATQNRPSLGPTPDFAQCTQSNPSGSAPDFQTMGLLQDDVCDENQNDRNGLRLFGVSPSDTFFCDTVAFASDPITTTTTTTTTPSTTTTSTSTTTSVDSRPVSAAYRFANTVANDRLGQFLSTDGENDRLVVKQIASAEQAVRFTISPSGRLVAIFLNRAVNGLLSYVVDGAFDIAGNIDLRSADDDGPQFGGSVIPLTCSVDVNGFLSCARGPTTRGPGLGPTTAFVQYEQPFVALGLGGDDICNEDSQLDDRRDLELHVVGLSDTFFCDTVAFASE
ncbi:hypothetical protein CBER1_10585 [Cercospora berteroae]|uniref:Uncharacterized protein n=1 Tax=Cercospora berteroae TaxID=357750 RepID=A0A2S6BXP2_9PEZI|nr:hypothetical protein CBER1_10585 [Cercospora berteroae]